MYQVVVFLLALTITACNADIRNHGDLVTKIPPSEGPAEYPSGKKGISPTLIGGTPVDPANPFVQGILKIRTDNAGCTASLIGPRVMISAAHCGKNGSKSEFLVNGKSYSTVNERSPLYPGKDHDVMLGLVSEPVEGIQYHSVTSTPPKVGDEVVLYGFGCINPGGGGGNDGILRTGTTKITSFSNYDFVTKKPNGAALCFGDSGGPGFVSVDGNLFQLGVNSKGNISDTSYLADTSKTASQDFFKAFTEKHSVEICGINKDCLGPPMIKIQMESEMLGTFTVDLKPETADPDFVKTNLGNLIRFLEKDLKGPESGTSPPFGQCSQN
jgi:hypothetical protein